MGTYPGLGTGLNTMVMILQHQQVSEERGKGHPIILDKSVDMLAISLNHQRGHPKRVCTILQGIH